MTASIVACLGEHFQDSPSSPGPRLKTLDGYFCALLDLLPVESYFDSDSLSQLWSLKNAKQTTRKFQNRLENLSVTQSIQFLEKSDEQLQARVADNTSARGRLRNRISAMSSQRQGKKNSTESRAKKKREKFPEKKKIVKKNKGKRVVTDEAQGSSEGPSTPDSTPLFSRFTFMNNETGGKKDGKRKKTNAELLVAAEKRQAAISAMREENSGLAKEVETKDAWQKALDKAKGVKVKDDPKILRKLVRKEHSLKRRSARRWADRNKQEAERVAERQNKRQRNLDKAKASRAKSRMRKAVRKGHVLPGF